MFIFDAAMLGTLRYIFLVVVGVGASLAQPIKAVFGILEGNGVSYPHSGIFYRWEDINNGVTMASLGPINGVESFGSDLAYDPNSKHLFVIGGSPNPFTWRGSVYALDIWHSQVPSPIYLDSVEARRIAVWETLLLVTRANPPFFTAYRISYTPGVGLISLDSLWSPTHSLLRSVPEGILVWGDTAYIALSYEAGNFSNKDSLVLAINLRNGQVEGNWIVAPNPTEIVRVGDSLYVACYGDFSGNLRISRVLPSSSAVTTWDAGAQSYGGFTTDTNGVRDTILFWEAGSGQLRAFDLRNGQLVPGAYRGIASSGFPFIPYALMWVGNQIWMSYTNYADTSLIIFYDPIDIPTPPHLDTVFVHMGLGGTSYPSLRRYIYVYEDDTSFISTSLPAQVRHAGFSIWPNPTNAWLNYYLPCKEARFTIWDIRGHQVREWSPVLGPIYVGDLPAGLYLIEARCKEGQVERQRFLKE
ncbi:MAG: T9SS type A sorting domain-containing protein [Bacteroidia bacterium]|nr:T9SS type A sorting domain-containing protein [Bacteroidia bacterium]